jgi:hypothetical protein
VAALLTLLAAPTRVVAAPSVPAATPQSAAAAPPQETVIRVPAVLPQVGLGALQLAAGTAAGIGGTALLMAAGLNPNALDSEYAALAILGLTAPVLTSAAVCGTGYLSSRYRGRCWTSVVGAYSGVVLGVLLGVLLAPAPDPDSTAEFTNAMWGALGGAVLMPIGAVAGWHLGKQEVAQPAQSVAGATIGLTLPLGTLRW